MDIDSPFTMVVLIVLVTVAAGTIKAWLDARENRSLDREAQERIHKLETEVDRLTERVRTLERLATDPDRRLEDQFRNLA